MLKFFVFFARTCDRCGSFLDCLPHCGGKGRRSFGGRGDVKKALMWLCFQSGGSAVSVSPVLFITSLGEIICRCSGIILALSSHVRCSLLGYISSPLRACLTISYHIVQQHPQDSSIKNITEHHPFFRGESSICAIITALQTVTSFYCSLWQPAGASDSEDSTLPMLIHKLLHETPQ